MSVPHLFTLPGRLRDMKWLIGVLDGLFIALARRHPFILDWLRSIVNRSLDEAEAELDWEWRHPLKLEHATLAALAVAAGQLLIALGHGDKAAAAAAFTAVVLAFLPAVQGLFKAKQ